MIKNWKTSSLLFVCGGLLAAGAHNLESNFVDHLSDYHLSDDATKTDDQKGQDKAKDSSKDGNDSYYYDSKGDYHWYQDGGEVS